MNRKVALSIVFLLGILLLYVIISQNKKKSSEVQETAIQVQIPEVYELANIILALTEYGMQDNNQVKKNHPYYHRMLSHFQSYADHPLIDSVNFSRELWKEFLSFRTYTEAFVFDENKSLKRTNDFQKHFYPKTYLSQIEIN